MRAKRFHAGNGGHQHTREDHACFTTSPDGVVQNSKVVLKCCCQSALRVMAGKTKIDGIKIHATGMMRLINKAPKKYNKFFP
jgi:hypothetical protein